MSGWIGALAGLGSAISDIGDRQMTEAENRRKSVRDENKAKAVAKYSQGLVTEENIRQAKRRRIDESRIHSRNRAESQTDYERTKTDAAKLRAENRRVQLSDAEATTAASRQKAMLSELAKVNMAVGKGELDELQAIKVRRAIRSDYGFDNKGLSGGSSVVDPTAVAKRMTERKAAAKKKAAEEASAKKSAAGGQGGVLDTVVNAVTGEKPVSRVQARRRSEPRQSSLSKQKKVDRGIAIGKKVEQSRELVESNSLITSPSRLTKAKRRKLDAAIRVMLKYGSDVDKATATKVRQILKYGGSK